MSAEEADRLARVELDEASLAHPNPDVEHERRVAIYDLLEENVFKLGDGFAGPYVLHLSIQENRLVFDVRAEDDGPLKAFHLSLSPFRRIVKDYFMMCESYHAAIRDATPSQIEAIDMGRRGLHNEGSELLAERLKGKIETDFDTARRLFTLLCALHWKG
ncbi:MAG: UPF0262 family protein [Rhodothalassiaceae bacterium]